MFAQRTVFLGLPPSADMLRCISANVPSAGLAAVFEKPNKATSTVTPPQARFSRARPLVNASSAALKMRQALCTRSLDRPRSAQQKAATRRSDSFAAVVALRAMLLAGRSRPLADLAQCRLPAASFVTCRVQMLQGPAILPICALFLASSLLCYSLFIQRARQARARSTAVKRCASTCTALPPAALLVRLLPCQQRRARTSSWRLTMSRPHLL